jgi:hypothetical protein
VIRVADRKPILRALGAHIDSIRELVPAARVPEWIELIEGAPEGWLGP